jgi:thiol-disulfide isomerase/thioredoxin
LVLAAVFAGAIAGLAAIYGIDGLLRNGSVSPDAAACSGAVAKVDRLAPLVRGDVAALVLAQRPRALPDLSFRDGEGREVRLSDFRGRTILINLWATWCVPCREEMPALDRLEQALGGPDFAVVAIDLDGGDHDKPRRFLEEIGVRHLRYYEDRKLGVFQELRRTGRVIGLPTSILVDPAGCELAVLSGPADWAGADAVALLHVAVGNSPTQ